MRPGFVEWWRAIGSRAALLAAVWACAASADGLQPSRDFSRHDARCRNADRDASADEPAGCARIRGYIPAGSDPGGAARVERPPSPFEPLIRPVVTGIGVVAAPIGSALGQVPFFLPARENDQIR
ncbi:MAG: hypothetical protein JO288_19120 [Hyphomicrobiales bacterium]|nr:hypothetical protein [Hyphomicrobiales bacterium]